MSSFPFCANLDVYHPINIKKENAICFIFQPDKPRRCVELGLKALKLVKASKLLREIDFEIETKEKNKETSKTRKRKITYGNTK